MMGGEALLGTSIHQNTGFEQTESSLRKFGYKKLQILRVLVADF